MKRSIPAVVAGLVTWVVVASVLDRLLRLTLAGYAAAEPQMTFTLAMMAARLTIGGLSSLAAGAVAGVITAPGARAPWVLGVILLAAFVPEHVMIWKSLPPWYHLIFLVSLVPLTVLGAHLASGRVRPHP